MSKEPWITRAQKFTIKYWNAMLGGSSLAGVALFSIIPSLQSLVGLFVFLAANSVVWTVVELKVDLARQARVQQIHGNMMAARSHIVAEIKGQLRRTNPANPLKLTLVGGRMRSMSDIVREIANDFARGRITGWLEVDAYCIDPQYLAGRVLCGDMKPEAQLKRNRAIAGLIESVKDELCGLSGDHGSGGSISVCVTTYRHDPYFYAYVVGESTIFWGPFTWSRTTSDLLGPENPCMVVERASVEFDPLKDWIDTRTSLYQAESGTNH